MAQSLQRMSLCRAAASVAPLLGFVCIAPPLWAQCPDGTPPPCAARRLPAPRLDERTWIVLPFENVAHAPDVDWLHDVSVNLLYLELSRWRDIHVIDDERVADLLRQTPAARSGALGLETGLAIARRVGAGRLVMGDLLRVGSRTALVAKVFDAGSGQRLRTAREEVAVADSALPAFGRLARNVLELGAAPVGGGSVVGTASVAAYRAYAAGVAALNAWDLTGADSSFRRAIVLDSGFALAHYKLSQVLGWRSPLSPQRARSAEAAARFGTGLPPRERTLVAGQLAQTRGRWAEACDLYLPLLRADSTDVEAWYNLGECSYHDPAVLPDPADTARARFRSSWNTALRAMMRALELDPSYHLAFQHIQDILYNERRNGCRERSPGTCGETFAAIVERDGDTIVTQPLTMPRLFDVLRRPMTISRREARQANLVQARDIAGRWVTSAADEFRAHLTYGRTLLATGDPQGAAREFATASSLSVPGDMIRGLAAVMPVRIELLLKLDSVAEGRRLADSLLAVAAPDPSTTALAAFLQATLFGRPHLFSRIVPEGTPLGRYAVALAQLGAGVVPDSLDAHEEAFRRFVTGPAGAGTMGVPAAPEILQASSMLAFPMRRPRIAIDTTGVGPPFKLLAAMVSLDSAQARRTLRAFDDMLAEVPREAPDDGGLFLAAQAHLVLGDSAVALEQLLDFERRWAFLPLLTSFSPSGINPVIMVWGRASLLLADLASARGRREDAIRAYRRVLELWHEAEPEIQPSVSRARAALARLGAN